MTTFKDSKSQDKLSIAEILETLSDGMLPLRFTAYDGSTAAPKMPTTDCISSRLAEPLISQRRPAISAWPARTSPAISKPRVFTPVIRTRSCASWVTNSTSSARPH
ncbi:hypothetical protein GCM10020255_045420 [Rhodococcus baikonurensis]